MARARASPLSAGWTRAWAMIARGSHVPVAYRSQQAALVRARIRALAPVIATLTLVWIPIDAIGLNPVEFARILPLRLVLAVGLLLLARASARLSPDAAAMWFVWLQALAFGAMQLCLEPAQGNVLRVGYGLFPFLVAAQLAVLPLPWGAFLRAALAVLALLLAPLLLDGRAFDAALWNDLWLLGLILALAAWAGQAQLSLLIGLLGARSDAAHDALTGLANRRSAEQRLEADHARALRLPESLSVLMIDLDRFKQVNDRWGHAAGDRVLVATAQVLRDELRGADLGARYGGEEFLAILPSTAAVPAMEVAERIRAGIAKQVVEGSSGPIQVTASIGVATLDPSESAAALIARADAALYRAKAEGRNRCVDATPDIADDARVPIADA